MIILQVYVLTQVINWPTSWNGSACGLSDSAALIAASWEPGGWGRFWHCDHSQHPMASLRSQHDDDYVVAFWVICAAAEALPLLSGGVAARRALCQPGCRVGAC